MALKEGLQKIVELTGDQSYSHAARMIEIKKEAEKLLKELGSAEQKAAGGGKAGDKAKEESAPAPR